MKTILLLAAVLTMGMISCKKDEEVKPVKIEQSSVAGPGDRKDMGGWD